MFEINRNLLNPSFCYFIFQCNQIQNKLPTKHFWAKILWCSVDRYKEIKHFQLPSLWLAGFI